MSEPIAPLHAHVTPWARDPTYSHTGQLRTKANIWQPPITYGRLARLAGMTQDHISRIFRGERRPNMTTLRKLSLALNMDVFELMRRMNY